MASTYDPSRFYPRSIEAAKAIILTPEGSTTEQRWASETPYLVDMLERHFRPVTSDTLVLDYGCGIGRIAKELIARTRCKVIGCDISPTMLAMSHDFVRAPEWFACPPPMMAKYVVSEFDCAYSIWTLQHCFDPREDVAIIKSKLKPGGKLFVVNNVWRAVPVDNGRWANDGIDIAALLNENFKLLDKGQLDRSFIADSLHDVTFWAVYQKEDAR